MRRAHASGNVGGRARKWAAPLLLVSALWLVATSAARAADLEEVPGDEERRPYSVTDPLLATVAGTLRAQYPALPERVPSRSERLARMDPARVPTVFFDQSSVRYSIAAQKYDAPLVFVIAGTGSRYSSARMQFLEKFLYGNGFHVVSLSSPTHPDFILSASRHHVPGYMKEDVEDLYTLMKRIRDAHPKVAATSYSVVGYSLGGTEAAFLAERDAVERAFNFERVLLINPSVSLYDSSRILDKMFAEAVPTSSDPNYDGIHQLITQLFEQVTPYIHQRTRGELDNDFLFHIVDLGAVNQQQLTAMIATVFRLALANMVFTVDVANGGGHVIEKQRKVTATTSLTDSFKRSTRWDFDRYINEMVVPFWESRVPGLGRDRLIADASLISIAGFLAANPRVGVITNADDIILGPGDLAFIERTFGERAKIFPHGGHLGSMEHRDFAAAILAWLRPSRGGGA